MDPQTIPIDFVKMIYGVFLQIYYLHGLPDPLHGPPG